MKIKVAIAVDRSFKDEIEVVQKTYEDSFLVSYAVKVEVK